VRYFFYIGGNDSSDTVRIVNEEAEGANYEMRAIHIPKTIDNDLMLNDHTPGFPSAARFVAQSFMGANLDNRALPGVYIAVVMGRHAGFLTAAAALARKYEDDGPHLIYIPEHPFDIDVFLGEVKDCMEKRGRCMIAVSEGICDAGHQPIITKLVDTVEKDAHGNVQLSGTGALGDLLAEKIKKSLGFKRVRSDTFGYLQRSFIGCVSDIDQAEAREVGEKAAQYAVWNNVDGSIVIKRRGNYSVDYELVPLAEIAGKTRVMPPEFYDVKTKNVTDKFYLYGRPLLGRDFPQPHRIRARRDPEDPAPRWAVRRNEAGAKAPRRRFPALRGAARARSDAAEILLDQLVEHALLPEDVVDHLAHRALAAGRLGDEVGRLAHVGVGVGDRDLEAGRAEGGQVVHVVADVGHLALLEPVAAHRLLEGARLVGDVLVDLSTPEPRRA
jgi:6-phosphofructokinase 1